MEDDLEEKVLKQACVSQFKFVSRFATGIFSTIFNKQYHNNLKILLRPEVFILIIVFFVFCFYLQAVELDANGFLNRLSRKFINHSKVSVSFPNPSDSWEKIEKSSAMFAVQGRRARMEDR